MNNSAGDLPLNAHRGRTVAWWVILSAAALYSVFLVPQWVPVSPSVSGSYLFGYNNRAGVLILLGYLVLAGYFSNTLHIKFLFPASSTRISMRAIAAWMAVYTLGWIVMCLLVHGLHGFLESRYLIERVDTLAEGGKPYKDFEFAYGALFLYVPRLLMVFHLNTEWSYLVFWLACLLAGVWMLARVLEMLDYPSPHRMEIFHLLCLFNLPVLIYTGANYALLRFLPASYFGLLVQRTDARGGFRHRCIAILLAIAFTVVLLAISPEMALAYAAGVLGYFAVFGWWDPPSAAAYGGLLLGEAGVLVAAGRLGLFATLQEFSRGAFNFPIIPAPHILFLLFACGLVSFFVAARLRQGSRGDGMLMVIAVSAATLFAALGRCDPEHTGLSAIGILIPATLLVSSMPRLWNAYRIAFLTLFVLLPSVTSLSSYRGLVSRVAPMPANPLTAFPQSEGMLQAPFGFNPSGFGHPHVAGIATGYYDGLENALTPPAVERKIAELAANPNRKLLLPDNFEAPCKVDPAADRRMIQRLFAYPYRGKLRHTDSVLQPLCGYIQDHYRRTAELGPQVPGFSIWARP